MYQAREFSNAIGCLGIIVLLNIWGTASMWIGSLIIKALGWKEIGMVPLVPLVAACLMTLILRYGYLPLIRHKRLENEPYHSFSIRGTEIGIQYSPLFRARKEGVPQDEHISAFMRATSKALPSARSGAMTNTRSG